MDSPNAASSAAAAAPANSQRRRLRSAPPASSSAVAAAAAASSASAPAWEQLPLFEQLSALEDDEALAVMADAADSDPSFLGSIATWPKPLLLVMSAKLKIVERSSKLMRADIVRRIQGYATPGSASSDEGSPPRVRPAAAAATGASNASSPRRGASSRRAAALAAFGKLPSSHGASYSPARAASSRRRGQSGAAASRRVNLASLASTSSDDSDFSDTGASDVDWSEKEEEAPATHSARNKLRRSEQLEEKLAAHGVQRSFANEFVRNAQAAAGGRTLYQLYKYDVTARFSDAHSHAKKECIALSRIVDALNSGDRRLALELTCRRLGGVQTAAETGSWALCEMLETESSQQSFIPAKFLGAALKSVNRYNAIKKSVAESRGGNSFGGSGPSNQRERGRKDGKQFTSAASAKSGPAQEEGVSASSAKKKKAAGSGKK